MSNDQNIILLRSGLSHLFDIDARQIALVVLAIINWEYSGFFLLKFERPFYRRRGPSIALPDEVDDMEILLVIMALKKEA